MKFLSLFSGIGGLDLGLERAGMTCVGQVEIDQFCCRVLAKHWPNVKRMNDIREVKGDEFGPIDCIAGGFPCQDVSRAGLQAGIKEGTRSGLWSEYCRLIRVVRPRIVIVENVPGLLDGGIGRVLGDLAESGFDAEWQCIPACGVGLFHTRDRVFVCAYSKGAVSELFRDEGGEWRRQIESRRLAGSKAVSKWPSERFFGEPDVAPLVDGISARLGKSGIGKALGNAVVPQVAEVIGRAIMGSEAKETNEHHS